MVLAKRRVWRKAVLVLAVLLASMGLTAVFAQPASASVAYWVDVNDACHVMFPGSLGASLYEWSPDGIYCYGVSVGVSTDGPGMDASYSGHLDKGKLYWYCKQKYGSSFDDKVGPGWWNPLNAWWCMSPTG